MRSVQGSIRARELAGFNSKQGAMKSVRVHFQATES